MLLANATTPTISSNPTPAAVGQIHAGSRANAPGRGDHAPRSCARVCGANTRGPPGPFVFFPHDGTAGGPPIISEPPLSAPTGMPGALEPPALPATSTASAVGTPATPASAATGP